LCLAQISAASPRPSISQRHESAYGAWNVVVAFAPRPDDQIRPERAGEVRSLADDPAGLPADIIIGVDEPATAEAGIEVEPAGDAVDVVAGERRPDVVQVLRGELVGVVELVSVDHVAEARDGAMHLVGDRLSVVVVLGLIPGGHEARDHRPEGPNAETRLHCSSFS